LDSLAKQDDQGKMVLTSTEKVTVEKFKMCVEAFKRLRDDAREGDPESGDGNSDGFPKGRKSGVMLNVTIIKH
jgi:hypothetical protein